MDYLNFYKLNNIPFSNTPDNRFFFDSKNHKDALIRLRHSADVMSGFVLVVGHIGSGKTTLARKFLASLDDHDFEAALLVMIHTEITADWLLHRIASQLGVKNPGSRKADLLPALYDRLYNLYEENKKAIVIIDEAQMLQTREIMEEFRGMLNLEVPGRKLIHFLFFGLPEVEELIKIDPPLYHRMTMRIKLSPFKFTETVEYIIHRLKVAGATYPVFSKESFQIIFDASKGIPRLINTICDNCLFEGYLLRANVISSNITSDVVDNLAIEV